MGKSFVFGYCFLHDNAILPLAQQGQEIGTGYREFLILPLPK